MKLRLPYCYKTKSKDGHAGKIALPPYVVQKSVFDDSLTDSQISAHLTATLNRYGNKVRGMKVTRSRDRVAVTCYSDHSIECPGELWTMQLELVSDVRTS